MSLSGATRLVSSSAENSCASTCSIGASVNVPALLTRMSGAPSNAWRTRVTTSSTAAAFDTSQAIGSAPAPSAAAAAASVDSVRAIIATRLPAATSACVIASPIPRDAPVTTAEVRVRRPCAGGGSASVVLDIIVVGLPQPQPTQPAWRDALLERAPNRDHDVL